MTELHLSKKDFHVEWFSGTGSGGQYRNKHQNCCRITHIASGLRTQSTRHRDRPSNQREAFVRLARLLIAKWKTENTPEKPEISNEVVRSYHEPRNEVLDKASGERLSYVEVVEKRNLGPLIDARCHAKRLQAQTNP